MMRSIPEIQKPVDMKNFQSIRNSSQKLQIPNQFADKSGSDPGKPLHSSMNRKIMGPKSFEIDDKIEL